MRGDFLSPCPHPNDRRRHGYHHARAHAIPGGQMMAGVHFENRLQATLFYFPTVKARHALLQHACKKLASRRRVQFCGVHVSEARYQTRFPTSRNPKP